jgi:hypothetical protein
MRTAGSISTVKTEQTRQELKRWPDEEAFRGTPTQNSGF